MEELITKAQKGDTEAFTKIIISMKNELYKIAKTRITNESDIDDVIQETMLETFRSIKKLRDPKKLKMWIIKILINKCNKVYRKKYKKEISIDEYNLDNYIVINSQKNIEDDINFYQLIQNLKYEERIVVLLFYMEEYSVEEISKMIKMNQNTVKTNLYRARQKIKKKIELEEKKEGKVWKI